MSKFSIGPDVANMIQVESDPEYQTMEMAADIPRRVKRNLNGITLVQYGLQRRRWSGSIHFDNRNLIAYLYDLYEKDSFYFLDETEPTPANDPVPIDDTSGDPITDLSGSTITDIGVPLQHDPVEVRWVGEPVVVYDTTNLLTGAVLFEFIEVTGRDTSLNYSDFNIVNDG